jgi:peptidyl-prolyl cis-trans isomerase D
VTQAALGLKPQEFSKPIVLDDGVMLLQVVERKESVVPPLTQIKDRVAEAARQEKAIQAAAQEAKKILSRLQQGDPLAKVAAQYGLTVKDSGFFTRPQGFPGQTQARNLTSAAFALTPANRFPADPISLNGENFLLAFKERRPPSPEQFTQAKAQMEQSLLEVKRQMVFSQWLAEERRRAKISVYELPS